MALGLGLSVLAAVGQIDSNLRSAIARDLPQKAPSYFFVDIQPDQIEPFLAQVRANPAVTEVQTAPMMRGVVARINGADAAKVAGNHWVVRGSRGIPYAAARPEGSTVVARQGGPVRSYVPPPPSSVP